MYGTILPPDFHHALNDSNTSYSLSDVHHTSKIGGPPSEADSLCGPMEPIPTTRCSSQDSNPSNVLADWGAVAPWTLGVTSPFYQEVLEGTGVLDAALTTHASYSVGHALTFYPPILILRLRTRIFTIAHSPASTELSVRI